MAMPASEDGSSDAGSDAPPPERTNLLVRFRRAAQLVGRTASSTSLLLLSTREKRQARREILAKPAAERTESELLLLEEVLSRLKFAKSLRVAEKVELCKSMGYRKILAGETLFRQGDPGDHFYVIIVGCVSVHIQDAQTGEDHEVAVLRNGDSFGELALMQEGNLRAASIIAKDDSEFLTIFRDDYSRILGAVSEHELADKVNLLRGLPAFRNVPHSMVRSVAYVMSTRDYARNALVLRQGDEVEDVYFVERGGVRLVREVEDRAALRALRVDEDGPGAALRGAAREGFAAEPPEAPGVGEIAEDLDAEFEHLREGEDVDSSAQERVESALDLSRDEEDSAEEDDLLPGLRERLTRALTTRARCVSRGAEEDAGGENAASSEGPQGSSAGERGAGEGEVAGVRRAAPSRSDSKRSRGGGAAAREGLGRLFLEVGTVPPGDYFGAVTLTRRTPQVTSAITTEPTRCYVLNKWDLIKRVDSEAVTRFQASKVRFGRFAADDAGLIAEFHRAREWRQYKSSLTREVVEAKKRAAREKGR